jgi:phosphoribosyl-dephospho-CoA transferase
MFESWHRHDLLRVEPRAWPRVLRRHPDLAVLPEVAQWATLGRPLIVRRHSPEDEENSLPVALALPPSSGKRRVALQVETLDICKKIPSVTLRSVEKDAPLPWLPTVTAVLEVAKETGVEPWIFGSFLWEMLTGLSYLTATSDLDLLWPIVDRSCVTYLVSRLGDIAAGSNVRLDGEVILPWGGGVNWRELHSGTSEVLLKTMSRVQLQPVTTLFEGHLYN